MGSFGQYLARVGAVSREALCEATEALVIVGGRLGTNLVDLGCLEVEELDRQLARFLDVPLPSQEWIESPDREALVAVPARTLRRFFILPLKIEKGVLHVAMADPGRPDVVDELGFSTGLALRPYVLSEAHLAYLRERHLGLGRPRRFASLAPGWAKPPAAPAPAEDARPSPGPEEASALRFREMHGLRPVEGSDLIDRETFAALFDSTFAGARDSEAEPPELELLTPADPEPDPESPADDEPPPGPGELAELEERLATVSDRDELVACALRIASAHAETAALFLVHRGNVQGFRAVGGTIAECIEGVFLPVSAPSVFAAVASGGWAYRGAPPKGGIDAPLLRMLGRNEARDVAVLPVRVGERVLSLLYVDNGPRRLANTSIAALVALAGCIGKAYARMLLARRKKHCDE